MTLEEIKKTDWYQSRPKVIQDLVEECPPSLYYRIKATKEVCTLYSYHEDRTLTVNKLGIGGPLAGTGLEILNQGIGVFGLRPEDIEPLTESEASGVKNILNERNAPLN